MVPYSRNFTLFVVCLFVAVGTVMGQSNQISGRVVNKTTREPVVNASVFISGTSRGTISNAEGKFTLLNVPIGKYDLVITSVNYQSYVRAFSGSELPLEVEVLLEPQAAMLEAVVVRPYEEETWEKWGLFFTESFIGTSLYSKHCVIKNKDAIKFRYYKNERVMEAYSEGPIIIENKALGYIIQYQLEAFQWNVSDRRLMYYGFTLFEDMSDDRRRVPRRWAYNRKSVYEGSMVHFFKSLYHGQVNDQGFEVRVLKKRKNEERERVSVIYANTKRIIDSSQGRIDVLTNTDSLDYYTKVMRQSEYLDYLEKNPIRVENYIINDSAYEKPFFFNDYLHIIYKKKLEDTEYLTHLRESRKPFNPTSIIFLDNKQPITVDPAGNFNPPHEVFTSGYWAWSEKVATLLPLDYDPEELLKVKR